MLESVTEENSDGNSSTSAIKWVGYIQFPCEYRGLSSAKMTFILSTVATPLVLGITIIGMQMVQQLRARRRSQMSFSRSQQIPQAAVSKGESALKVNEKNFWDALHESTQRLMTTKSLPGQVLSLVAVLASLISFGIYLVDVAQVPDGINNGTFLEYCFDPKITYHIPWIIDVNLNAFFIVHFIIRFVASNNKLSFIIEPFSVVDYATVPPVFCSWFLNRTWTGFRFMRVLYLMHIPDLLQYLGVLRSRTSMRLAQLLSMICGSFLACAGMFHLLEHYGDHGHTYWEFVYFCIVTAGTVGYGDIACRTGLGRAFNAVFILSTLAVVASVLPDIFKIIASRKKYGGSYDEAGKRHIVVCGNVNYASAGTFLKEFLHKDRGSYEIKVVFMDLKEPDSEWEGLLKRHFADVEYLQGTAMNSHDLQRAKAHNCEACIIVANKYCLDPDAEDAANIMRVIAIKNYNSSTRVIVELMQYHNKAYLLNIPSWNWRNGDEVICLAELKLGLIAQSCIAPGFSTLMANLFTSRSITSTEKEESWRAEYLRGTEMEMYSETLSPAFENKTFAEASEICFLKLDILLIAISFWDDREQDHVMIINPKPDTILTADTQGFFIADSAGDVQRAAAYCLVCHHNVNRLTQIKKCSCSHAPITDADSPNHSGSPKHNLTQFDRRTSMKANHEKVEIFIQNYPSTPRLSKRPYDMVMEPPNGPYLVVPLFSNTNGSVEHPQTPAHSENSISQSIKEGAVELYDGVMNEHLEESKFDSTGMFHWCAPRPFDSAVIDRHAAARKHFNGHVVVGIFADADSPLVGLNSLVMPLRSSNFKYEDLKEVVVLGNVDYLQREWKNLYNFPKITIVKGSALSRADLRALSVHNCSMCVILTAKIPNSNDLTLTDKEVIMASLNIKAMDFEPRAMARLSKAPSGAGERTILGNETSSNTGKRRIRIGARIPMITDLFNDPNVQYLDPDDDDTSDQNTGFFATEPFACGAAFTASVLDSLASMVYYNPSSFRVIRALIFGGASSELEEILAEGAGIIGGAQISDADNRNRSFVGQIKMKEPPFNYYANATFGEFFVDALRDYGLLCIGIFRLLNEDLESGSGSGKRYVITKPAPNNRLRESDSIFVLRQSDVDGASINMTRSTSTI